MKTSDRGIELIKSFEGCKLQTYHCSAGVATIGYGHTGKDVRPGMVITQETAEKLLRQDLARFEAGVAKSAQKTTQGQFDALVSFAFNLGLGALSGSTLLKMHNDGKYSEAAKRFPQWDKADGTHNGKDDDGDGLIDEAGEKQRLTGLTRRREAEAKLYAS